MAYGVRVTRNGSHFARGRRLTVGHPVAATTEKVCWDVYADWGLTMRIFPDEPIGPLGVLTFVRL